MRYKFKTSQDLDKLERWVELKVREGYVLVHFVQSEDDYILHYTVAMEKASI